MVEEELKVIGKRLKKVVEGFNSMKHLGIDEDILICWLRCKTNLSKTDITTLLKSQEEFYERLLNKSILKALKD